MEKAGVRQTKSAISAGCADEANSQRIIHICTRNKTCLHMSRLAAPQANFLSLPPEIQFKIIRQLFRTRAPVIPLITSCKTLYNRFGFLIYRWHTYNLTVTPKTLRDRYVRSLTLDDKKLKDLSVLRIKIYKIPRTTYQAHYLSFVGSKKSPHCFTNLLSLSLSTDSAHVLFDLLKMLPPGLQDLRIIYAGRARFAQVHSRDLYSPEARLTRGNLKFFYIASLKPLSKTVLHPHITSFHTSGPIEENVAMAGRSQRVRYWESSIALFNQHRDESEVYFGNLLYDILHNSKETLKMIEFSNFDVGIVFDVENRNLPFRVKTLRLFHFDSVSQNGADNWLPLLQEENKNNGRVNSIPVPLLILNDKLGKVLYYKRVSETFSYQHGGRSLLSTWHKAAPNLLDELRRSIGIFFH